MEQARYWMWASRKPVAATNLYGESWEEQAFAEDAAGALGGCVWPPRSYSCTFCRREFRSAQALGGHMNVHRRDRARLKQSPIQQTEMISSSPNLALAMHPSACTFLYQNPNPNFPNSSGPLLAGGIRVSSPAKADGSNLCFLSSTNKVVCRKEKVVRTSDCDDDYDDESSGRCKRRRIEAKPKPKSNPKSGGGYGYRSCFVQTDVLKLSSSNSDEALDLELRLGDGPKVK